MYGTEEGKREKRAGPPASETQSADGPSEVLPEPKHKPPPSTGDLDLDVTGQSYIQWCPLSLSLSLSLSLPEEDMRSDAFFSF